MFQHTAARRRLHLFGRLSSEGGVVSTHSRAEAAAVAAVVFYCRLFSVSTHSRAEAAAPHLLGLPSTRITVSTHSRAEAAANGDVIVLGGLAVSTHSRAEAAAATKAATSKPIGVSTHSRAEAAAYVQWFGFVFPSLVSTHSRAEAAAQPVMRRPVPLARFNTQPRRGGCL